MDSPDVIPAEIVAYRIGYDQASQAAHLQQIEWAAGACFRDVGIADVAHVFMSRALK